VSTESASTTAEPVAKIGSSRWFAEIIGAVNKPISFYVLVTLVDLLLLIYFNKGEGQPHIVNSLIIVQVVILAIVTYLTVRHPESLAGQSRASPLAEPAPAPESESALEDPDKMPSTAQDSGLFKRVQQLNEDIYGARATPPNLDCWYRDLQPTLHQASFYTVPTYFLDHDLYIVDYNPAFEIIFRRSAGYLRGRHVNWFIAQLQNHQQVHEHGREFTERVANANVFPLIDMEPIVYDSPDYGRIEFTKIASQLHDSDGKLKGWAVALVLKQIAWDKFEGKLGEKLRQDKLWSVYSASYDRILTSFPPYCKLIAEVIDVLPATDLLVADLGAGTGNVTAALLERGQRVVAIENNVGMLDRFRSKSRLSGSVTVIKDTIEDCERLKEGIFDGVVMVNVLYAVEDPLSCLRQVHRLLKPGGTLGFSTTHRETSLTELLDAIKTHLRTNGTFETLASDYLTLYKLNREIEHTIALRWTRDQYQEFLRAAGFEITRVLPSTYHNAVMVVHARKKST